jgi:hypothetical protein
MPRMELRKRWADRMRAPAVVVKVVSMVLNIFLLKVLELW